MSDPITIQHDECENLEKLHYEYNSLVEVEKGYLDGHMLDENGQAINSPIYETFHAKTTKAFKAYEEAKQELMDKYDLNDKNWQLNFKTGEITIA